jgi:hypothetical protein
MFGTIGSLNVSVACGALYEAVRQTNPSASKTVKEIEKIKRNQDFGFDSFFR